MSLLSCSNVQHLVPGLTHSVHTEPQGWGEGGRAKWVTLSESVADLGEKGLLLSEGEGGGQQAKIQDAQAVADQGCWVGGGVLISRTINRKLRGGFVCRSWVTPERRGDKVT